MLKNFQSARRPRKTMAQSPEEFFGFHSEDIEVIHFHLQGVGEGTWFRLNDGRVLNRFAELCDPDPSFLTLQRTERARSSFRSLRCHP
jgi:hypothetical protein